MEKYKICPSCGTKNGPTLVECMNCEADLTGVKITDEKTEKMIEENSNSQSSNNVMVRICDCGNKNPANARKCSSCGEDISDITPTADTQEVKEENKYILSSLDGEYAYQLKENELIVGRENAMSDYLIAKSYVSRSHAKLTVEDDNLFVENLSTTNFTFVNNKQINEKTKLQDGDELGLGGTSINGNRQSQAAYFLVRIGQCM